MIITCLSPNGGAETSGPDPVTMIKVATIRGVYTLHRPSIESAWSVTSRALTDFQISALLFERRSGRLFAGMHGGDGLWASDDGGANWSTKLAGIAYPHVYTLAAQYRGDRTVLFAGVEPVALYRSDDLGESWYEFPSIREVPGTERWIFPPPPHLPHVKHIAFHPGAPETLYACIEQGALLKTIDDGKSWSNVGDFISADDKFPNDSHRVVIKPSNPDELYFTTGEGLRYSSDAGLTWTVLTTREDRVGYPDALYLDPRDDNVVIMAGSGSAPQEWRQTRTSHAMVLRSPDGGRTWAELSEGLPDPVVGNIEAMGLHRWGDQLLLLAGTATGEVYAREGDAPEWSCIATGLPPISKAGHYRWFLSAEERLGIEDKMRGWKPSASP